MTVSVNADLESSVIQFRASHVFLDLCFQFSSCFVRLGDLYDLRYFWISVSSLVYDTSRFVFETSRLL